MPHLQTLLLVLLTAAAAACSKDVARDTSSPAAAAPVSDLTPIEDPSLVCMINDSYMGKPQIPVEVGGQTYFGCCPMCQERLANEPETRTAIDPVTGEPVDKATAILAHDPSGNVLYFGNAQNLRRHGQSRALNSSERTP
jgi:YHS domain-containing protein